MSKIPAFQFYPADWRKDLGVQSLSYHDRGVWFEMLCLMHESERRGLLILNGIAMDEDTVSRLLGLDKQILTTTLTTLLKLGVASRDEQTGAIMSRRMVRDEILRKIRTEAGKKGGNPALLNQTPNQTPTTPPNQKPTPSSSSSVSSSEVTGGSTPASRPVLAHSPGGNGEFFAATAFMQNVGLAATAGDIRVMAQVIQFESRAFDGDMERTVDWLTERTGEARNRGEPVTVFWFKDRKFAKEGKGISTEGWE